MISPFQLGQFAQLSANRAPKKPSYADLLRGATEDEGMPGAGQEALNTSARSAVEAAMPSFYQALQGVRENAVRRGISTGDLGTSFEGDLASAFQRNIVNDIGSRAQDQYQFSRGNYLDLLAGGADRDMAERNARRSRQGGLFGALGGIAGTLIGGPAGGALGSRIGGAVGGY